MTAPLADYEWLTSGAAAPFLERCAEHQGGLTRLIGSLRKELSATRAHLVIEQVELRTRAKEKFTRAAEMFFTRKGFEQATDEPIAAYKAQRYEPDGVVLDVCCGIGGDLLALGQRCGQAVYGLDADPVVAHLARHNVALLADNRVQVLTNVAEDVVAEYVSAWHVDPDRRATGKRATTLEQFVPAQELLATWARDNARGGIKVAPATDISPAWQAVAEREWIGSRGECRQQMVWFGGLARQIGKRTATIVTDGAPRQVVEQADAVLNAAHAPRRFIHEPHAAVLAAQLTASLAAGHHLQALIPDGGYLTSDAPSSDAALACFEVEEVLPFDIKKLKAYFRERNIGRLEIKKRGLDADPERVRKQLELRGDESATLILARVGASSLAIAACRVEKADSVPGTEYQVRSAEPNVSND